MAINFNTTYQDVQYLINKNQERIAYIYGLKDPRDEQIKYIGKTVNPKHRKKAHQQDKDGTKRWNWINYLKTQGLRPELVIIDEVPESNWVFWEKHYIKLFKSLGADLKNGTDGGDSAHFTKDANHLRSLSLRRTKSKPILQYDLNGNFVAEYIDPYHIPIVIENKKKATHINSCCHSKKNTAYGFVWRFKNGDIPLNIEVNIKKAAIIDKYDTDGNLISSYNSISEAALKNGYTTNKISASIHFNKNKSGKYKIYLIDGFVYVRRDIDDISELLSRKRDKPYRKNKI